MAAQKQETLTGESQSTNAAGREQKSDSSQKVGKKAQNNSRHRDQTGKELRDDSKSHGKSAIYVWVQPFTYLLFLDLGIFFYFSSSASLAW
jgi:hypothetical protein